MNEDVFIEKCKNMVAKKTRNHLKVKCLNCGEILISVYLYDFQFCNCENCATAIGGSEKSFQQYSAKDLSKLEVWNSEEETWTSATILKEQKESLAKIHKEQLFKETKKYKDFKWNEIIERHGGEKNFLKWLKNWIEEPLSDEDALDIIVDLVYHSNMDNELKKDLIVFLEKCDQLVLDFNEIMFEDDEETT